MTEALSTDELAQVVIRGLGAGKTVEIEGLGTFHPDTALGIPLRPLDPAAGIHRAREGRRGGGRAALAEPGGGRLQPVDRRAQAAAGAELAESHRERHRELGFLRGLLLDPRGEQEGRVPSPNSGTGWIARGAVPLDEIFVCRRRLDACRMPRPIQRELQYIDLFPDWGRGARRMVATMRRELARRSGPRARVSPQYAAREAAGRGAGSKARVVRDTGSAPAAPRS